MTARTIEPLASPPDAVVRMPGSKSLTNRALVAAALADGVSRLDGGLLADDTEAMLAGLSALGIGITVDRAGPAVEVRGCAGEVRPGPVTVDARLSGTTARFLAPVLAAGRGEYVLDGAPPLRARPMAPLLTALAALGVEVVPLADAGHLPVRLTTGGITGRSVEVSGDVSSQFLSGLLLAAPATTGGLAIDLTTPLVSQPYVDLTLRTMSVFGVEVERPSPQRFVVPPGGYRPATFAIEPDASAASYFFAAAAITGGRVRVEGLQRDGWQGDIGFLDVLERMGATVEAGAGGVEVRGGDLHGIEVDLADLSDTAQTLAAVAVFADGPTTVTGIGFIRGKETDRIGAVVAELRRCGITAEEHDDGFTVHPGTPEAAEIRTYDDHRMAMSFALLGLTVPGIRIADPGCVAKTFPGFFEILDQLRR